MSSASKIKGSTYEAKIRDILSKELNKDFKRVPLSGSLEWLKGDIFCLEGFDFCIECKHYADLEWNNLLTAKSTDILSFWTQAKTQADKTNSKPLLIFRWNRSKDYAAWDDYSIETESAIHVKSFGHDFKVTLLDQWLASYKNQQKKTS